MNLESLMHEALEAVSKMETTLSHYLNSVESLRFVSLNLHLKGGHGSWEWWIDFCVVVSVLQKRKEACILGTHSNQKLFDSNWYWITWPPFGEGKVCFLHWEARHNMSFLSEKPAWQSEPMTVKCPSKVNDYSKKLLKWMCIPTKWVSCKSYWMVLDVSGIHDMKSELYTVLLCTIYILSTYIRL